MIQSKSNNNLTNWEIVSVNPSDKKWTSTDLFCFWGVNIQSIIAFSLIASLYLVYELNFLVVLAGSLLGSFFVYIFANLIGRPSQKHGIPFPVLLRTSLGFRGAKYFSLLRGSVGIFMFGVQTYFLSKAISYLIRISIFSLDNSLLDQDIFLIFLLGLNIIDWSAFIISIFLQTYLFSIGINYNKRLINFSAIAVYTGMIFFLFVVLLSDVKITSQAFMDIMNLKNFLSMDNIIPLITVAGTIFAYFSIIIVSFGDFSRYVKDEKELNTGNLSLILNLIIFSLFSVFIVVGSDVFLNQQFEDINRIFTNPTDIIGKFDNLKLTTIVLFFIIIASASTNLVANFIPTQYSLINFAPNNLSLKKASYTIATLGFFIGIFWPTLLSQIGILSIIDTLGSFFGPFFGIMVVNYYSLNKSSLEIRGIHVSDNESPYHFSNGWHIKAIYSLFVGFILSSSTIWNPNLMFLQSYAWIIGAFVAGFTYYLLAKK